MWIEHAQQAGNGALVKSLFRSYRSAALLSSDAYTEMRDLICESRSSAALSVKTAAKKAAVRRTIKRARLG